MVINGHQWSSMVINGVTESVTYRSRATRGMIFFLPICHMLYLMREAIRGHQGSSRGNQRAIIIEIE